MGLGSSGALSVACARVLLQAAGRKATATEVAARGLGDGAGVPRHAVGGGPHDERHGAAHPLPPQAGRRAGAGEGGGEPQAGEAGGGDGGRAQPDEVDGGRAARAPEALAGSLPAPLPGDRPAGLGGRGGGGGGRPGGARGRDERQPRPARGAGPVLAGVGRHGASAAQHGRAGRQADRGRRRRWCRHRPLPGARSRWCTSSRGWASAASTASSRVRAPRA